MKRFLSILALSCLLMAVWYACVSVALGQELQDLNQLLGKKVVLQRIQFCEPGTLHYTMDHSGETATVLAVTPKVYGSKSLIARGIPSIKDPEMRKLAADALKTGIVVVQLKDGTKLDTCWPISPGNASSWVELAEGESLSPAAMTQKPAGAPVTKQDSPRPVVSGAAKPTGAAAIGEVSFHGISVGQPISTLPFKCEGVVYCEGTIDLNYVRVDKMDSTVQMFEVIYEGKTLFPQHSITSSPITLAQALKLHSLQDGASTPRLGYAKDVHGTIYGLADVENRITYTTMLNSSQMGGSQVKEVSYLGPTAPVINEARHALLKDADAASLLAEARTVPPYRSAGTVSKPDIGTTVSGAESVASAAPESFRFAGIPWGSNVETVKRLMAESKLAFDKTDDDGDLWFKGIVLDYSAQIIAFMSKSDGLVKISVSLMTPDNKAIGVYKDTKETLLKLYGSAYKSFEFFESPYYTGDGYEEQAFRLGKGHFSTFWGSSDPLEEDHLAVAISERLTVDIQYESSLYHKEAEKRKAAASSILKKH